MRSRKYFIIITCMLREVVMLSFKCKLILLIKCAHAACGQIYQMDTFQTPRRNEQLGKLIFLIH